MPYVRGLPLARSLLLVGLLLVGPLGALVQPAAALEEPGEGATIRFYHGNAHFLEGERVVMYLTGFRDSSTLVRVRCVECPDRDKAYESPARDRLVFPDDFVHGSADAVADQQPRWQGAWRVSLHPYGAPASTLERLFHVHLVNAFALANGTASPSQTLVFRSAGHADGDLVGFELKHRTSDGAFRNRWTASVSATKGVAEWRWHIPLEEAQRLKCGERPPGYCWDYRVEVHSGSKSAEMEEFIVEPARLDVDLIRGPVSPVDKRFPGEVNRSSNEEVVVAIRYPDGRMLTESHLEHPIRNPEGVLDFAVEKVRASAPQEQVLDRWDLVGRRDARLNLWFTNWTMPKNETLDETVTYRIVLQRTHDLWGNPIPRTVVANFTAEAAKLVPEPAHVPRYAERTAKASVDLNITYLDGSPFTPEHNATEFHAYFTCVDGELPKEACVRPDARYKATPEYVGNGTWRFSHRFPKDYANVFRAHHFHMDAGKDHWNNEVVAVDLAKRVTLIPANPRIDLRTIVGGEQRDAETGFMRDETVNVQATITYPDGTPFNGTLNRHGGDQLILLVNRITRDGAIASQQEVTLHNRDETRGRWTGSFEIARTRESAPVGNWTLRLRVEDTIGPRPNTNETEILRPVHPLPIRVLPRLQPGVHDSTHCDRPCVEVGENAKYGFLLRYVNGVPVPEDVVGSGLRVDVARYDPENGTFHESVTGELLPAQEGREWIVEWIVPRNVFDRTLAFRVQGTDRHGNPVEEESGSRAFDTYTKPTSRVIVTNPVTRVERGKTVYAVFDGLEGDTGLHGAGNATIALERWDPAEGRWVVESRDVRDPDASGPDHVARWQPGATTTLGEYHFVLQGRDASYRELRATTRSFEVWPTNVTRPLLTLPPEVAAKGSVLTFSYARVPGDRIIASEVRLNGELIRENGAALAPVHQLFPESTNVTWRIPIEAKSGNYTLRFRGYDLYGNVITVDVPQVTATPSRLTGQILSNPPRILPRSDAATFSFGIRYPDGRLFNLEEPPRVLVLNDTGLVAEAEVTRQDLAFEARWTPEPDAVKTDYWFEIAGQDDSGNVLPAFRSTPFRVTSGDFERTLAEGPGAEGRSGGSSMMRLANLKVALASDPADAFVAAELRYLGPSTQSYEILIEESVEGMTLGQLPHTVDPATGQYVVNWRPDLGARTGWYVIEFEGQDVHGNAFHAKTRPFEVRPVNLVPDWLEQPRKEDFEPGAAVRYEFTIRYTTRGTNEYLDDSLGIPSVNMEWDGKPVLPQPRVEYHRDLNRWVATWEIPESFPKGRYELVVQGADDEGNQITRVRSRPFTYEPSFLQSFTKVVPGTAHLGTLLALALAAAGMANRTVKDRPNRK